MCDIKKKKKKYNLEGTKQEKKKENNWEVLINCKKIDRIGLVKKEIVQLYKLCEDKIIAKVNYIDFVLSDSKKLKESYIHVSLFIHTRIHIHTHTHT